MRDVAGMVRSFDYAAAAVERQSSLSQSGDSNSRAIGLLDQFRTAARAGLMAGYEEGAGAPLNTAQLRLLDLFTLEKAAYEIAYEAANRPDWLAVPTRGLASAVERILGGSKGNGFC